MIAIIYINGIIGTINDVKGVELVDIISQVAASPLADEYKVIINSEGGLCSVGYSIYNYLRSLNKPITTVGRGLVASIATIPFLAGDTRILEPNAKLMIHNPWANVEGDVDELEYAALQMRAEEDKMIAMYAKHTIVSKAGLDELMKIETYLDATKAFELGFATSTGVELKAVAYINSDINKNVMSNTILKKIDEIFAFMKGSKALDVTAADGKKVTLESEDGIPKIGEKILVDGELLTGEVMLADGTMVKADIGIITEVMPVVAVEEPIDEVEALKAENEALKTQLASLAQKHEDFENDTVKKLEEVHVALRRTKSTFEAVAPVSFAPAIVADDFATELANRKKSYKK